MGQLDSVQALIALEDASPDSLFDSVNGMHIWPLIRVGLGLRSANREVGTGGSRGPWRRSNPAKQLGELAVPNSSYSRRIRKDADALFVTIGGTSRPTPEGRENWLVDYFAAAMDGRAIALQDRPIPSRGGAAMKPSFKYTYSLRDAHLRVLAKSKLKKLPDQAESQVRRIVREIVHHYPFEVDPALRSTLEGKAVQQVQRAPHWRSEFERILSRTSPELVVMDLASYMTRAAITQTIRQHGLPIAEPQHGWIGASHAAYNFGSAFFKPELKQYLPDALLTFGDFWSESLRTPSRLVSVGKPYLERAAIVSSKVARNQVLITSSIYKTEELIALALSIRDALPRNMSVAVRPHPSERPRADSLYAALAGQERVSIDVEPDVYVSFSQSSAVIGYASTVLFEALAFDIPVLVIDSPLADLYTPEAVFGDRISADGPVRDVIERITNLEANDLRDSASETLDRIWKPNAVDNFNQFLSSMDPASNHDAP